MRKHDDMRQSERKKGGEGIFVDARLQYVYVQDELNAFPHENQAQQDPQTVYPFGMMCFSPLVDALQDVHNESFSGSKNSVTLIYEIPVTLPLASLLRQ